MPLTDLDIRNAKPKSKPYKLTDSHGLYLEIRPRGSKLWRYRYRLDGKENTYAIGAYGTKSHEYSLAEARAERVAARALVKQGIHPGRARKREKLRQLQENAGTFRLVAEEWIARNDGHWSPYYRAQVTRTLASDVYPRIGNLSVREITPQHLLEILRRIEARGAVSVALLVRQWSSAIFRYAIATLRADTDPAAALRGAIKRPRVRHHPALAASEIPTFLERLQTYGGYRHTRIALELLLLTFVRPGELRAARWEEFDLDAATWRIPAERMKMRTPHVVPLSLQAIALLNELREISGGNPLLFPNLRRPKVCMTMTTLNRALERMGYQGKLSAHGFRATASTLLNEMGYRADLIERQLAHAERNSVRASYNQAEYLQERRAMMQEWADFVTRSAEDRIHPLFQEELPG